MTDNLVVYEIPAGNMPGLLHKLAGLSKKSQKILGKPIALNVVAEVQQPLMTSDKFGQPVQAVDFDGHPIFEAFFRVTIDAETPKINGWTFIATIDHSATSGNIIRVSPNAGCEVPAKYRSIKPICDHCAKIRSRRDTFLLRNDATGEFKQIGRQCIRDFIGYDITAVVAMAEIVGHAMPGESDGDMDWSGGMRDRRYIPVKTYLAHVAALVRKAGWISRKDEEYGRGQSTASAAHFNLFPPPNTERRLLVPLIDRDFETAAAALAWAAAIPVRSDFDNNLNVVANETMVEHRSIGILAYVVPGYFRHVQRAFEQTERRTAMKLNESQHIGTVGAKIGTGKQHTMQPIDAVLYGFASYSGTYGTSYIYRFQTNDGNVVVWSATAKDDALDGVDAAKRIKVRIIGGTVKKHGVYKEVKETVLTRCKIERVV